MEIPILNMAAEPPVVPHQTYKVGVRRKTRGVMIGGVKVGGAAPISVQTMTKTKTGDVSATVAQIIQATEAGCDIVRVTVNDKEAAEAMKEIVRQSPIPVVADIHFNHVFALKAIEANVAKVRINPGNIGSRDRIHEVLAAGHLDHERLAGRHVESHRHAPERGQHEDVPGSHQVGPHQRGKHKRQQHHAALRPQQHRPFRMPVRDRPTP